MFEYKQSDENRFFATKNTFTSRRHPFRSSSFLISSFYAITSRVYRVRGDLLDKGFFLSPVCPAGLRYIDLILFICKL